jgi:uncharacterized protein (DUF305 family)
MTRFLPILIALLIASACSDERASNQNGGEHHPVAHNTIATSPSPADHHTTHDGGTDHATMKSSPNASSAPLELQFLDTMIAHHNGAVEMAMLAETRAERSELKALAANIIDTQEREMAKMSQWRDHWFEGKPEAINMSFPGMSDGMKEMDLKKLGSLRGNEFDLEFIRQMIPHHLGAVEMAKSIKSNDSYAELKELAEDMITTQESEVKQMREWLAKWER